MAQNRTCNLSVTGRPSSSLRHVFKVHSQHKVPTINSVENALEGIEHAN
jgi:hypothetical protein